MPEPRVTYEVLDERLKSLAALWEAKLECLRDLVIKQEHYVKESTTQARTDVDRRLDGMNSIREQLAMQASEYVSLATYEAKHEGLQSQFSAKFDDLQKQVNELNEFKAELKGKATVSQVVFGSLISIAGAIATALLINYLTHR